MAKKIQAPETEEAVQSAPEAVEQASPAPSFSFNAFLEKYQRLLLWGLGAVVLVIAGIIGYRIWQQSRNTEAENQMYQAIRYWEQDSLRLALEGDGQFPGFSEISESYGGTDAANLSTVYLGLSALEQGDLDGGIEYLEKYSTGDNMLTMAVYTRLAFAWEDKGEPKKAASYFEKAASIPGSNPQTSPLLLMQAARVYESLGEKGSARRLYERIRDDYPESEEARSIEKYIGRVSE
jgi:tetratricopeptide (TPR) repeat protein